jgi:hypothetical protein
MTLLETCAGLNIHLAKNFGIENPFTTINEDYHQDFKVKIAKMLKISDPEWRRLWIILKEVTHNHLAKQELKINIPLVSLIQSLVFKIVMLKFFPNDSKLDEDAAITNITRLINMIWIDLKHSQNLDSTGGILFTLRKILKRDLS